MKTVATSKITRSANVLRKTEHKFRFSLTEMTLYLGILVQHQNRLGKKSRVHYMKAKLYQEKSTIT